MNLLGDAMLGIVHPCKIYNNMLVVGAPAICIGPQPSHVTEILNYRVRNILGVRCGMAKVNF